MEYHTLKLAGLTRKIPLIHVGKNTRLARFSILGDVELVDKVADIIAKKIKKTDFDHLVAPAVNVLPLVHGVALRLGHSHFVVCRKTIRPYMVSPITVQPLSHFPKHVQPLTINGPDADMLKNKKVFILDDVVSTGITIRMIEKLMEKVNAKVIGHACVLKQGKSFDPIPDLIYLQELPIFKNI